MSYHACVIDTQADEELRALGSSGSSSSCDPKGSMNTAEQETGEYSERTRQALLRLPAGAIPADLVGMLLADLDEKVSCVVDQEGMLSYSPDSSLTHPWRVS